MALIDFDPQSSGPRKSGRLGLFVGFLVLAGIAAGAGYWIGRRAPSPDPVSSQAPIAAAPVPAPYAPVAAPTGPTPPAAGLAPAIPAPAAASPAAAAPSPTGPRRVSASLAGPFEETITAALGPGSQTLAAELTQVANRLLVWNLQIAKDGRKGDRIEILFSPAPPGGSGASGSQEPVVDALRFTSQKRGKTFSAYRWQAPGAKYPRYYAADGSEVEERLVDGPIRDYEQVTSLVRDGRKHKGVDFRAPVGTPVHAPFDGVIERRNWKFASNGNCLDLLEPTSGRHAIFLHLDVVPKEMQKGRAVKKGEQIAVSGNSGHSFAPHLHYQLEAPGGRVLDPFTVHRTRRETLSAADLPAFQKERARLDALLAAGPN
jgi:murein DD-endopeptidase MepM/ murein hydrolase activator NlpD